MPAIFAVNSGQVSVQLAKMNVIASTLPRRSFSAIRFPCCEVSVNSDAGPIFGRVCGGAKHAHNKAKRSDER